jgi:hypothetical protein
VIVAKSEAQANASFKSFSEMDGYWIHNVKRNKTVPVCLYRLYCQTMKLLVAYKYSSIDLNVVFVLNWNWFYLKQDAL